MASRIAAGPVAMLVAVLVLAGCGVARTTGASGQTAQNHGFHGALLDRQYVVPDQSLADTGGKRFSMRHDAGHPLSVVFFGYTHCPDTCRIVMGTIASAYARLQPSTQRHVQVLFVSTDPVRDTLPVLRAYLRHFNRAFVGLRAPLPEVIKLARPMAIFVAKGRTLPGGGYDVDHSIAVLAVRDGRVPLVWTADTTPADMADDLNRLLKG
ncbi:MAG: SCO family protein [Actinomycetota bacterium]|nr:SCO family protein [Actinomycetota bacterium]